MDSVTWLKKEIVKLIIVVWLMKIGLWIIEFNFGPLDKKSKVFHPIVKNKNINNWAM